MSATDSTNRSGASLPAMQRGHRRWLRQRDRLKKDELRSQIAAAAVAVRDLQRKYDRALEKACRAESRGIAAQAAAFDEADNLMNRLQATNVEVAQLRRRLEALQ